MRWFSYFILAYVALGLQAGLARAIEWRSTDPNFVLLAVVFIALNAPRDTALLGCFLLGAMQDLAGGGTMGLLAFSYGLVAMFIAAIQQAVYRKHPMTHLTLALLAGILTAFILAIHGWVRPTGPEKTSDGRVLVGLHPAAMSMFYTAVYSAILALVCGGGVAADQQGLPLSIGSAENVIQVFSTDGLCSSDG